LRHKDVPPSSIKNRHLEIPVIRHSRESVNPEKSRRWIPAYAGMTGISSFPNVIENEAKQKSRLLLCVL
jgi:hypothetical protein